ncbi:MAG: methyltransferase domain-containing protein [Proteobacteria bacterium]|nr:methyltransferase domain-containing protein [Pseudomonadota bacterium]
MAEAARDRAQAALARGLALEDTGDFAAAFDCFREATELDPSCGRAWRLAGNLLRRSGRLGPASECFERAIAGGDDPALNAFFLSAVGVGEVVAAPPGGFVAQLFDQYADRFDAHLRQELNYRAPQRLFEAVARPGAARHARVLDLGCGTGLAGLAFKPIADAIVGVDVSSRMLAHAERTGAYEALVHDSIEHYLASTEPAAFDLVICCDAFNYVGALDAAFAGVRRALRPGGGFAFTVELTAARAGIDLLASLRYAHARPYVEGVAERHGYLTQALVEVTLREEDGEPVEGLAVCLQRP